MLLLDSQPAFQDELHHQTGLFLKFLPFPGFSPIPNKKPVL